MFVPLVQSPRRHTGRQWSLRLMLLSVLASIAVLMPPIAAPTNAALQGNEYERSKGFDTCAAPSASMMNTWFTHSPYKYIGIYIGGSAQACPQPNLTSTWLTNRNDGGYGWSFILTWVGPQSACSNFSPQFSNDANTAFGQGASQAQQAIVAANNLGFTGSLMIYYDLEGYSGSPLSTCRTAAKSFMKGWADHMNNYGHRAGLYGSSCSSYISDHASNGNPPDDVWLANHNNMPSVWAVSCVSSSLWTTHQRLHQYVGGHNETYNNVTINIDTNCADGHVAPDDSVSSSVPACYQ